MNRDEYLFQFERWVGRSKQRKTRARVELDEHLDGAEETGELDSALKRLGGSSQRNVKRQRAFEVLAKTVVVIESKVERSKREAV